MTTTEQDRQAIAHLVKRRRDAAVAAMRGRIDGWDHQGISAALAKVADLDLSIVTIAAMRAAADVELKTPGAIGNPASSCYRDRLALNSHVPVEKFQECSEHVGQKAGNCSWCAAERIGGDGPTTPQRRPVAAALASGVSEAREALAAARGAL